MKHCATEEEFLAAERAHYDNNHFIKEKNYTDNMLKDAKLKWQLMQKMIPVLQGYYDRDEIHLLLNGHNAGVSKESLHDWHLEPYEIAEKIAFRLSFDHHDSIAENPGTPGEGLVNAWLTGVAFDRWSYSLEIFRCTVCDTCCMWETIGIDFRVTPWRAPNPAMVEIFGADCNDYMLPCQKADSIQPFKTQFRVSSGKVVVDDDLREAYPEMEAKRFKNNICVVSGRKKETKSWAKLNVVACPNSNIRPHFVKNIKTGEFMVARPPKDPKDEDAVIDHPEKLFKKHGYRHIGRIYTDLWWWMMADHDEFVARGGKLTESDRFVVEMPNGLYELTHYEHNDMPKEWGDEGYILTEMKRIGD